MSRSLFSAFSCHALLLAAVPGAGLVFARDPGRLPGDKEGKGAKGGKGGRGVGLFRVVIEAPPTGVPLSQPFPRGQIDAEIKAHHQK